MNRRTGMLLTLAFAALLLPLTSLARYMNPNTGRFQTMDSYEGNQTEPLSLHKYLYAHANPVNRIDPSGRFSVMEINIVRAIQWSLRTTSTKYLILGAGIVGGYAAGRYAVQEEVTDPKLIDAVAYMKTTIAENKSSILQYTKEHNLGYDSVDEIPSFQPVKQSRGLNLLGFEMVTEPWGTTKVSNRWLSSENPGVPELQSLLAHEYGHILYRHWFITPSNEAQANEFQVWFCLQFMGLDVRD